VLEAEIKPGQHHLRFSMTARVCSLMVSDNLPGASGFSGDRKTGVNRCIAIVRYRRMFEDIRRKMNIEATQNNRTNRRVEVVFS